MTDFSFFKFSKFVFFAIILIFAIRPISSFGMVINKADLNEDVSKKVLFVSSYPVNSHTWAKNVLNGFDRFIKASIRAVDYSVFETGILRNPEGRPPARMIEKIEEKLKSEIPDVIVLCDMPAIMLFGERFSEYVRDIPVVLCGYPSFLEHMLPKFENSVSIKRAVDILGNIEMGMRLFPNTEKIAIITDSTVEGVGIHNKAKELLRGFKAAAVKYINGAEYGSVEMLRALKELPQNSIVLYISWKSSKPEMFQTQESIVSILKEYVKGPILTTADLESEKIFGGMISSGFAHGEMAARIICHIFEGNDIGSVESQERHADTKINWADARAFNVNQDLIPANAVIYGAPINPIEAYKFEISLVALAFVFMTLWLISFIMRYRLARRNAFIYGKLPIRISAFDKSGRIVFSHVNVNDENYRPITNISDLPPSLYGKFCEIIGRVRDTGKDADFVYDWGASKRKCTFTKLPENRFGKDIVMCVSIDVSELDQIHKELRRVVGHLNKTISAIGEGVIATDTRGKITLFNVVAESLTGYARQEAVGKKLENVFKTSVSASAPPLIATIKKAIETNRAAELPDNTDLISKNGERRHIAASASPITDMNGNLHGVVIVFRDVTQDYKKRDEIVAKNTLLNNATEIADMAYFVCDENIKLKDAKSNSSQIGKYWELNDGDPISAREWILPEDYANFSRAVSHFVNGKSEELDVFYRSGKNAEMRYFHMHVVKRKVKSGKVLEYFGIIQDVTKYKKNEFMYKDAMRFMNSILDNVPCSIFVKNLSDGGKYVLSSKFFNELVLGGSGTCNGMTDYDIFPFETARHYELTDAKIVSDNDVMDIIEDISAKDGSVCKCHTLKTSIETENGDIHLIGISLDVTELINIQDSMRSYIEQERIVNECLNLVLSSDDYKHITNGILKCIGEHLGADRCYIFEYGAEKKSAFKTVEWLAPDMGNTPNVFSSITEDDLSLWTGELNSNGVIKINSSAADCVGKNVACVLMKYGVKTMIAVGIWEGGQLWGFMGLDFIKAEHKFTEIDESILKAAARIFELYIERRRNMEILEQREAEKEMILNSVQIPVLLFDSNGNLVNINSAAEKITDGKTKETILSEPCHDNFCDRKFLKNECAIKKCLRTLKPCVTELRLRGRDYYSSANPVFDKNGNLINIVVSCVDLTDFYNSKRELERAMEAAKAADKAKSYFLATVSHELRTPLNAVIGYSELTQDESLSAKERHENLENINFAANALLTLVNDVLDLSKLEAGHMEIEKSALDIKATVSDVVRVFKYSVEKKGLQFDLRLPDEIPPLMLDPIRIKQVLMNIVGNAVKFTDEGSVSVNLRFAMKTEDSGTLTIEVSDTGMGISDEFMTKIFNPFERQPVDMVKGRYAYEGTGLGLSIAKRLVQNMGGDILVKSRLGVGSTFTIVLEGVKLADPSNMEVEAVKPLGVNDLSDFSGKVVIVDDVRMNLNVLGAVLSRLGIEYKAFTSGTEALNYVKNNDVALVLTDIWMPEISGAELAAAIKNEKKSSKTFVVAVTADTQVEEGDFDGVLFKPITIGNVSDLIGGIRRK